MTLYVTKTSLDNCLVYHLDSNGNILCWVVVNMEKINRSPNHKTVCYNCKKKISHRDIIAYYFFKRIGILEEVLNHNFYSFFKED